MVERAVSRAQESDWNRDKNSPDWLAYRHAGVRKLEQGLWEVRVNLSDTIARVLFTVDGSVMILLHGFIKKSQKTPAPDLATARQRKAALERHKR